MNEEQLEKYVNEYFEKYMSVSFDKFIENWKEQQELSKHFQQENQQLKEQLKQKDEVIDETIKMLDKLDTDIMQDTIIGFNQFLPRFYEIKEFLQKYKGVDDK